MEVRLCGGDFESELLRKHGWPRAALVDKAAEILEARAKLEELERQAHERSDASSYFLVYGSLGPGGPDPLSAGRYCR